MYSQVIILSSCIGFESGAPNDVLLLHSLKTLFSQITFRTLERHSRQRCQIFICSAILGHFESVRNY